MNAHFRCIMRPWFFFGLFPSFHPWLCACLRMVTMCHTRCLCWIIGTTMYYHKLARRTKKKKSTWTQPFMVLSLLCVYACISTHTQTHTHTHAYGRSHKYIYAYIHIYVYVCVSLDLHIECEILWYLPCFHAISAESMHAGIFTYIHTHSAHANTYVHRVLTYIMFMLTHAHTHTHTHTWLHVGSSIPARSTCIHSHTHTWLNVGSSIPARSTRRHQPRERRVWRGIYVYIYIYIYIFYMYIIYIYVCVCIYHIGLGHVHACMLIDIRIHTHTYIHACMHTCIHRHTLSHSLVNDGCIYIHV